jgi:FtsH-binding integral membrane protein
MPGVALSSIITIGILLLSSFAVKWQQPWHPLAITAWCVFFAWYLLYDVMEMLGKSQKHKIEQNDYVFASFVVYLDFLTCWMECLRAFGESSP